MSEKKDEPTAPPPPPAPVNATEPGQVTPAGGLSLEEAGQAYAAAAAEHAANTEQLSRAQHAYSQSQIGLAHAEAVLRAAAMRRALQ